MRRPSYDIIVVGAGPAGTSAARYAASAGASVLVLEKDRDVGYPVRCAEAVSHEGVVQFIDPDPRWIASTVTKFRMFAPNGTPVEAAIDGIGYILERRLFDYELAKIAAASGAEVHTKAYVYDLLKDEEGRAVGVKALIKDRPVEIRSRVVIAADGVESRVGKWAGIDTTCHIHDMETCAQMTVSGISVRESTLDFYLGDAVAPGGYLWVFPKGPGTANIGIGINVEQGRKRSAIRYLQDFMEARYPGAAVLTQIAGGVPCAKTCDELVKNHVMLVGDAGHQVNPLSGGGIITGMIGGMLAGQVAAEALQRDDLAYLKEYEKRWHKRLGWRHEAFYNIKEAFGKFTDKNLNGIADSALKIAPDQRTLGGIFRTALWDQPSLILEVAKVFLT